MSNINRRDLLRASALGTLYAGLRAAAARAELGKLPACPALDALTALTTFVIDRTA